MGAPVNSLSIAGYKSIERLENMPLSPLNILIGANGAKTQADRREREKKVRPTLTHATMITCTCPKCAKSAMLDSLSGYSLFFMTPMQVEDKDDEEVDPTLAADWWKDKVGPPEDDLRKKKSQSPILQHWSGILFFICPHCQNRFSERLSGVKAVMEFDWLTRPCIDCPGVGIMKSYESTPQVKPLRPKVIQIIRTGTAYFGCHTCGITTERELRQECLIDNSAQTPPIQPSFNTGTDGTT